MPGGVVHGTRRQPAAAAQSDLLPELTRLCQQTGAQWRAPRFSPPGTPYLVTITLRGQLVRCPFADLQAMQTYLSACLAYLQRPPVWTAMLTALRDGHASLQPGAGSLSQFMTDYLAEDAAQLTLLRAGQIPAASTPDAVSWPKRVA